MQSTLEKLEQPVLTTDGGGDRPYPPTEVAERNGDGEGDGRMVAAGISTAEAYANSGTIVELSGVHLAETVFGYAQHNRLNRGRLSIPTGRLTVRHEVPLFLT